MTSLNIKLPDSLARKAAELPAKDQIPLDQFVSLAVAEKMSGWLTEGYISERAKRGLELLDKLDRAFAKT